MLNNISFTGCIPVEFYAKHPITKKYVPIVKDENINKCQRWVVRNLNNTIQGHNRSDVFINAYKAIDSDYAKNPIVRSHFNKYAPRPKTAHGAAPRCVYLFSGKDVDCINKLGKELGKEKFDIFESTGEKDNSAIRQAQRRFREGVNDLINKICPRVNDGEGHSYVMRVLFKPEYNSKGDLKRFVYQDVFFDKEVKF